MDFLTHLNRKNYRENKEKEKEKRKTKVEHYKVDSKTINKDQHGQ